MTSYRSYPIIKPENSWLARWKKARVIDELLLGQLKKLPLRSTLTGRETHHLLTTFSAGRIMRPMQTNIISYHIFLIYHHWWYVRNRIHMTQCYNWYISYYSKTYKSMCICILMYMLGLWREHEQENGKHRQWSNPRGLPFSQVVTTTTSVPSTRSNCCVSLRSAERCGRSSWRVSDIQWLGRRGCHGKPQYKFWLVVWLTSILFSHILGISSSQLTNIFQRGWKHQPEFVYEPW